MQLNIKHAVITGGGTGIGAEIARTMASNGLRVSLLGRRLEPLLTLAEELRDNGVEVAVVSVDVADAESVEAGFAELNDYDILVNNAGMAKSAPISRTSHQLWEQTLSVNLTGVFLCSQQAVDHFQGRDYGRIINVASTAGLKGYSYVSAYCAAKHGVVGFTRALSKELARTNITVNAVCPGYTETPILTDTITTIIEKTGCNEEQARAQLLADNPQQRFVLPQEVAAAVYSLCLPDSRSINGQTIAIDGGETA